jgi:hypothetical protein
VIPSRSRALAGEPSEGISGMSDFLILFGIGAFVAMLMDATVGALICALAVFFTCWYVLELALS